MADKYFYKNNSMNFLWGREDEKRRQKNGQI